ncbi:hypothetical protein IWQ60_010142 [Tieghemiomyces parasiticus]|uniref:Zn(2)-C6 fungal-type domain-containing protein n=1 Tax=Tieghemiomyces parasiticus TaxID=78921 RepID=A0A9W8DK14_9FUNG|nr:hypothetical protein IWQ60_010142 [Tieghemiomyces parasiticus]
MSAGIGNDPLPPLAEEAATNQETAPSETRPTKALKYRRRACDRCVARKTGCDGNEPCTNCQQAGCDNLCVYSHIARQPPRKLGRRLVSSGHAPVPLRAVPYNLSDRHRPALVTQGQPPQPLPLPPVSSSSPLYESSASPKIPSVRSDSDSPVVQPRHGAGGIPVPAPPLTAPSLASPPPPRSFSLPNRDPMRITSLLAETEHDGSPDDPWNITSSSSPDTYAASTLTIIDALVAYYTNPYQHMSMTFFISDRLATEFSQVQRIDRSLKTPEDTLYSPALVRPLLALYVMHQVRIFCQPFLQRLYRKLDRGEISPASLNFMLCYGTCVVSESYMSLENRRAFSLAYLERLDHLSLTQLSDESALDIPLVLFLISRVHAFQKTSAGYVQFIALSGLEDDRPADPRQALHYDLDREYKRRTFHEVTSLECYASAFLGVPPTVNIRFTRVKPISDTLLYKMLTLPPEDDIYPALVPGMSHSVSGYPVFIELTDIAYDVCHLRARLPPVRLEDVDLQPYLTLNRRLDDLYPAIERQFPLDTTAAYTVAATSHHSRMMSSGSSSPLAGNPPPTTTTTTDTVNPPHDNAVYAAGQCMIHSIFHLTRVFLNVHNWAFGPRAFRPESYPVLREAASASVDHFTLHCLPYLQRLPVQGHSLVTSMALNMICFWYIHRLPYHYHHHSRTDAAHQQIRRDWAVIHRYRAYLDEFEPFVQYIKTYKAHLDQALEEIRSKYPGLVPEYLIGPRGLPNN